MGGGTTWNRRCRMMMQPKTRGAGVGTIWNWRLRMVVQPGTNVNVHKGNSTMTGNDATVTGDGDCIGDWRRWPASSGMNRSLAMVMLQMEMAARWRRWCISNVAEDGCVHKEKQQGATRQPSDVIVQQHQTHRKKIPPKWLCYHVETRIKRDRRRTMHKKFYGENFRSS